MKKIKYILIPIILLMTGCTTKINVPENSKNNTQSNISSEEQMIYKQTFPAHLNNFSMLNFEGLRGIPTWQVVLQEELPYSQVVEEDNELPEGTEYIKQEGQLGLFIHKQYIQDGEVLDESQVKTDPVDEIIVKGTKTQEQIVQEQAQEQVQEQDYHPTPSFEAIDDGTTFDIISSGTIPPKLQEGVDFGYQTAYFPGIYNAKDMLYRISSSTPEYQGFESYGFNNRLFVVESVTRTGKLFSGLKVGDVITLEGQEYQVKALEFPDTAQRDSYVPPFNNLTGLNESNDLAPVTNYGNTQILEHHLDYLISTAYNSPTTRLVQVCMDSRMVPASSWQSDPRRYTNKIIVLDLLNNKMSPMNVYPFIGWDYTSPVYNDIYYW